MKTFEVKFMHHAAFTTPGASCYQKEGSDSVSGLCSGAKVRAAAARGDNRRKEYRHLWYSRCEYMDRMMHTMDPSHMHNSISNIFQCYTLYNELCIDHHICFIEVTTLWVHGTSGRERGGFTSKPSQEWFSVLQWMWDLSIAVTGYSGVSRSRCSVQLWLSGVWQFTCGELCMHVAYFTWSDLCCLCVCCLWWDMLTRCSSITYYCIACIALILILSLIIYI